MGLHKVLVADDNADVRKLLRLTLGGQFEIIEAEDSATALGLIRSVRPAIVLLDVMMPGELDGYQVCEVIRADPALLGIRVALVTARGQQTDIQRGGTAGADAYIVKPYSPAMLLRQLQSWVAVGDTYP